MVGVELARRCGPFEAVAAIASADRIGDPDSWRQRAAVVREGGTTVLVDGAVGRWFAPGFSERRPTVAKRLLSALTAVDRASYAECCDALAEADLSGRLSDIRVPLLLAPGSEDEVVLVAQARQVASAALGARLRVLDRCGHLPPAEKPVRVAAILTDFFDTASDQQRRIRGIAVRREVLGVAHVDAAGTRVDRFTADFQDLITRYAWGDIWARPGLDRTTRSVVTLTALVALGHWEEFALHVGAAVRNGLTAEEISEVLLQTAIYCGVPAANRAFAVAQSVLSDGAAGKG
jgi:3-oxoadipate enol-lactonase/4-carboxymuconolactone decarboxylase